MVVVADSLPSVGTTTTDDLVVVFVVVAAVDVVFAALVLVVVDVVADSLLKIMSTVNQYEACEGTIY